MKTTKTFFYPLAIIFTVIALVVTMVIPLHQAYAGASLTGLSDTMDTLVASVDANHTIAFTTPTGVAAGEKIKITFPSGFNLADVDFADMDLYATTERTLAATCDAATWGAAVAAQTITFTSCTGTITAASAVSIKIGTVAADGTDMILNPSAGAKTVTVITTTSGDVTVDSGSYGLSIIADDSVNVTSSVGSFLTFAIDVTAIGFGTLSSSTATWATGDLAGTTTQPTLGTGAHEMSVATNAAGYSVTFNGATLTNPLSQTITATTGGIVNDGNGTQNAEQFAISVSESDNGVPAAGYDYDTGGETADYKYALSTPTEIVGEDIPTATEIYDVYYLANIANTTEQGTYTTDITYIATGTF